MKGLTCEDLSFWLLLALRIDKDNDSLNQTFLGLPDNASETTSLCLFVFCFIPNTVSFSCFPQPLFFLFLPLLWLPACMAFVACAASATFGLALVAFAFYFALAMLTWKSICLLIQFVAYSTFVVLSRRHWAGRRQQNQKEGHPTSNAPTRAITITRTVTKTTAARTRTPRTRTTRTTRNARTARIGTIRKTRATRTTRTPRTTRKKTTRTTRTYHKNI